MNALAPYENVTLLYGHIHRDHEHQQGHVYHYAAGSLIFAFPDPDKVPEKKPLPFDKDHPFRNLGIRVVSEKGYRAAPGSLTVQDVELTLREFLRHQRGSTADQEPESVAAFIGNHNSYERGFVS